MKLIINSNSLHIPLADKSVQCVVTSPPYFALRDYGIDGQIGLEKTPAEYIETMVNVFRDVWRVLRDDGTLWVNIGDSYCSPNGRTTGHTYETRGPNSQMKHMTKAQNAGVKISYGNFKPKDLVGIPWRLAFALQDDGWYLRSDIIWHKPNPMPESVTDRPTKAHEYIFLLSKRQRYFYDADSIMEPYKQDSIGRYKYEMDGTSPGARQPGKSTSRRKTERGIRAPNEKGRNKRDVWSVPTQSYTGSHFATFPPKLIEPCILAGSRPGDIVLDPFSGTGTTGMVAIKHQRRYIGLELNFDYIEMSKDRTRNIQIQMI